MVMAQKEFKVEQAKKILGNLANGISDEEILREIKVAQLLKALFFTHLRSNKSSRVNQNGQT